MPPKPKFTREKVVEVALTLVGERGMAALTARELGETGKLGETDLYRFPEYGGTDRSRARSRYAEV